MSWFPTIRPVHVSASPWSAAAPQSQALVRLIVVAIEEKLPLAPLVEAWAADERGAQRSRLHTLASLLGTGMPLDDAVEEVTGVLADRYLLAIRFDKNMGTRTAAMRALLDEEPSSPPRQPGASRSLFYLYVGIVPLVAVVMGVFMHLNIIPPINKILSDFSIPRPEIFSWWQQLGNRLTSIALPLVLPLLVLAWFLMTTRAGRRFGRFLTGRLSRTARDVFIADVLQLLGVAVETGRPFSGALSMLARYHFDPGIRQKLLFARNEVEQGTEVWQSLIDARLLTREEAQLLHTGERLGNQPWTMSQVVAVRRQAANRRQVLAALFLWPMVIIALGGFVLFQALTVFIPMLEILRVL